MGTDNPSDTPTAAGDPAEEQLGVELTLEQRLLVRQAAPRRTFRPPWTERCRR